MASRGKLEDSDLRYMHSLGAAVVQRSPRYLILVLLLTALFVAAAIAWMNFAKIDMVVRGGGKVVPSQQLQILQSLEGGVVTEILALEGERVSVGQPLIKLSDVAFSSSFGENQILLRELRAKTARLRAEANGTAFKVSDDLIKEAPDLVNSAQQLFESNAGQQREVVSILEEKVLQNESEVIEARAKRRKLEQSLEFLREELELKEPLVVRGLVTRVEFLQLKKQENELAGELEGVELSIPRLESTIEEAKRTIEQSQLDFRNQARKELTETTAEAARIAEAQSALADRVRRTTLRSPVNGTVTRLHINTVGGVVPPGGPIMEIVPYEDALLVQLRIKPQDVAKIAVGQLARLRFSAYDSAIHGSLDGEVNFLSADTVTEEDSGSFYIARVKPVRTYFGRSTSRLPIRVGMTAEADIITDKKSILQYLLKPINRGLERALREG